MRRRFKFTKKKQSIKGIIAFICACSSVASFIFVLMDSFSKQGKGSVYLGSIGVFGLLVSFAGLLISYVSLKEEEIYKLIPYAGFILSVLTFIIWMGIYVIGFMG